MGTKNYTILISIFFIVLFMSADQQNKKTFPGLVPTPAEIEYLSSETKILGDITIDYNADDTELKNKIDLALSELIDIGYNTELLESSGISTIISVSVDENISNTAESYELDIIPDGITLRGSNHAGVFYGLQTLVQILETAKTENLSTLSSVSIKDSPRFQWRGMMLDVARHMFPADFVKRYIDIIAEHKMNVFHWHLTEVQGWRMPIAKYP